MARNDKVKAILDKTYFHLNKITSGFASFGSRCITKRPRMIFFISAVIIIAALFSSSRIGTEFDYKMLMRKNMPTYIVDRLQEKYFGRSRVGYLLIEGDVENPLLLEKMRLLQKRMGEYPDVEKILGVANVDSINDLIDKMQYSLPPKASPKEIFDIISESDKTANYVLDESYKDVASHLLRKRGDHYDGLLMKFYLTSSDAKKTQAFCNKINKDMKELKFDEIPGIHTKIGGGIIGFHVEEQYYVKNLASSFFVTLFMNFMVMLVVWRRFWQSLIAIAPIIFATILTLGLMPIFGLKLNILNLCIGSIIVGLGDDYPIHITERFVEERKKGLGRLEAAQAALSSLGSNIMACAMTSIIGFGAACIIAITVTESFGILIATSLFYVFVASIFILPVLLVGRRKDPVRPEPVQYPPPL
jgi:hypothetical protein